MGGNIFRDISRTSKPPGKDRIMAEAQEIVNNDKEVVKPTVFNFSNPPKKPEKQELEKQIEAIQGEIEKLQEKVQSVKVQIDKISNDRSGSKGEVDVAKAAIQKLYAEKKQLSLERAQMMASRDSARASLLARINQEKQLRGELKYNSLDAIDSQIKDLETRQATTSMTLQDEKKIIKDIKALQQSKKTVIALAELKATIDREKESTKSLEKAFGDKAGAFKNVNDRISAQREVLDNLNKDNTEHRDVVPGLRQQEKECNDLKNEKYQAIRNLRNDFKKREDAYYLYLREEKVRKHEARQKEIEAKKAEEEEKRKALEAEELAKVPYEEDMALCDYLILYLQKFSTDGDKDSPESAADSESADQPVDAVPEDGGMKVLRRDLEDLTMVASTKKRGKKKGGANLKKKDTLAHGVDTIDFFAMLEITPPSTISSISASIEALSMKKKFFQTSERGAVPSIADKNKAHKQQKQDEASAGSSKKTKSAFSLDSDFPTLGIAATKAKDQSNFVEA